MFKSLINEKIDWPWTFCPCKLCWLGDQSHHRFLVISVFFPVRVLGRLCFVKLLYWVVMNDWCSVARLWLQNKASMLRDLVCWSYIRKITIFEINKKNQIYNSMYTIYLWIVWCLLNINYLFFWYNSSVVYLI